MKLKVVVGVLVLLILGFTIFGENGLINLIRYKKRTQTLIQEVTRVKAENERLQEEVRRLKSDPAYIERLAREELGMVKPGERVLPGERPAKCLGVPQVLADCHAHLTAVQVEAFRPLFGGLEVARLVEKAAG